MEIQLTETQAHVDAQIESRLSRKCMSEWRAAKGNRKTCPPFRYSQDVSDLLELRQRLYAGEDPEGISARLIESYSHF